METRGAKNIILSASRILVQNVRVILSESLSLVLSTSYLLTQFCTISNWTIYSFPYNRDLYIIVSKPSDVNLKSTNYITYIVNTVKSIVHPSSFTSDRILMNLFPVAGVLDSSCCVAATCSCRSDTVGLAVWMVREYIRFCEVLDLCTSSSSLPFIL